MNTTARPAENKCVFSHREPIGFVLITIPNLFFRIAWGLDRGPPVLWKKGDRKYSANFMWLLLDFSCYLACLR